MLFSTCPDAWMGYLLGLLTGLAGLALWRGVQFWRDARATRTAVDTLTGTLSHESRALEAYERVTACKKRLRWQRSPNPEWITPLIEEIPLLVREIAVIYYPNAADPLRAPGLSHFTRAIHYAAMDVADFLQTHRVGRLVDISANTAWKTWEVSHKIVGDARFRRLQIWHKKLRPIWQVIRYKSPWMWLSLTASNIAVRTLQPAIIDIVAHRAIELYSGKLAAPMQREVL